MGSDSAPTTRWTKSIATAAGIALIAALMSLAALTEPPLGRMIGRVYTQDLRPLPGATIWVRPIGDMEGPSRGSIRTGADGRFELNALPVGAYALTAHSSAHGLAVPRIEVEEAMATPVALRLNRTLEPLTCASTAGTYLPSETAYVNVTGYVEPDAEMPRIELHRLDLPKLQRRPEGLAAFRQVYASWSQPDEVPTALAAHASLVRTISVNSHLADVEGHFEHRLPLGKLDAGVYYVIARYGRSDAYVGVTITDIALVVKKIGRRAHGFVANLKTGKPTPGATVSLYASGRPVVRNVADGAGLVRLDAGPTAPTPDTGERWSCAVAQLGSSYAFAYGYDPWSRSESTKVFVYTDRPVYRPGQEVRFKGIARKLRGPGPTYAVPAGMPIRVRAEDPEGVILTEHTAVAGPYGSFSGRLTLSPETPSGPCTIFTEADGVTDAYDFTVASYRKPEFSVTAQPKRPTYVAGDPVEVEIRAAYYYGAPLAGATVRYSTSWSPLWDSEGLSDDGEEYESPRWVESPDYGVVDVSATTNLDQDGRTVLRLPSNVAGGANSAQGHRMAVNVEVVDPNGRSVEMSTEARVFPGSVRLFLQPDGYVMAPNRPTGFMVRATDLDGKPVTALPITLEFSKQKASGSVIGSTPIGSVKSRTDQMGRARLMFAARSHGEIKAEAIALDPQGRRVSVQTHLWCVTDRGGDVATEYGDLSVHTDKRRYSEGDVARLLINSNRVGATALLTVEGETLHEIRAISLQSRSTVVRLPVRASYGPRVDVSVACVFRKRLASSGAQLRVDVPSRTLNVGVAPESGEYKPGTMANVALKIRDSRGNPMRAETSVAIVDEAIYSLMEDDPHAIMDAFYPWLYSRVTTMHSCEERLYSGDKGTPNVEARRRFEDAPFWAPHVLTDAQGSASVRARLPDNLTTWRVTAVAHTPGSKFGYGVAKLVTTLPFHVRLNLPRFLTETDRVRVTASVANASAMPRVASVRLTASGLLVDGGAVQRVPVPARGTAIVSWYATATRPGAARVRADAWTADAPRLADAIELPIEVRPLAREVTHVFAGQVTSGAAPAHSFETPVGTRHAAITLRLAPGPLASIPEALQYLRTFPYGCVEQTVSAFYPALIVADTLKRLPLGQAKPLRASLGARFDGDLVASVRDGITRLRRLQQADGAWGWFENDPGDVWLTAYALLGVRQAGRSGYSLPRGMVEQARTALARLANETNDHDARAFAALALAETGINALHRLDPDRMSASGLASATLAVHRLAASGSRPPSTGTPHTQPPGIQRYMDPLLTKLKGDDTLAWWPGRSDSGGYEWNRTMSTSLAIRAILAGSGNVAHAERAMRYVMVSRTDASWTSTRDTAFVVAAICAYVERHAEETPQPPPSMGPFRLLINGKPIGLGPSAADLGRSEFVSRISSVPLRAGANSLRLVPPSGRASYYSAMVRTHATGAMDRPISSEAGITLTRSFEVLNRASLPFRGVVRYYKPIGGSVQSGAVLRRRLVIQTRRELPYVMVTDPLPSGVEPSARGDVDAEWSEWYSSTDVRDDKVVFFARRVPPGKHVLEYYVRTQVPGRSTALPARLECMYSPAVRIETAAQVVTVR